MTKGGVRQWKRWATASLVTFWLAISVVGTTDTMRNVVGARIAFVPASRREARSRIVVRAEKGGYYISPETLDGIRQAVPLSDVVESVRLAKFRRTGPSSATALCPFHDDNNPSLTINDEKGIYKCWSCGASGNVFTFVREYHALPQGGSTDMSFPASVQWVSNKFLDEATQRQFTLPAFSKNGTKAREQSALIMQKRQQLLLANAAAGDYFCRNLITLPQAGVARTHLSERNIAPATVREFALGYAPDSYFSGPTQWGDGSLVQHLQSLNFTSQEIVDAGLATITKAHFNETNLQHSHIMDRFRGRLMVPIFDPTGKSVIAFGGRVLDTPGKAASWSEVLEDEGGPSPPKKKKNDFKAAKYINSPESLVFHKKNVLFGLHGSKEAMATREQDEGSQKRNEIVIVEGYFDAISLAAAGIRQVVASMGTALSIEQLDLAARTASSGHPGGGRVILCLDNDDAGKRAVERLCTSDILLRVVEDTAAEVLVATLPDGIKDPAEFVDEHDGEAFQQKILDTAVPWSDWYMERIVSVCDVGATSGSSDSFPQVCEAVSDFLSSFSNPADRTKRAYEAAGTLSKLLAPNRTDSVGGLRIQLETDLLDMASRKARTREALSRRVEESSGIQRGTNTNIAASLSKGESLSTNQTVSQLSRAALAIATRKNVKIPPSEKSASKKVVSQMKRSAKRKQEPRTEKVSHETKSWKKRSTAPSLTPHFTGFDFVNPTDARWLGIPENERPERKKVTLALGTGYSDHMSEREDGPNPRSTSSTPRDIVYFNSNTYHGDKFLTDVGRDAGYTDDGLTALAENMNIEFGVGTALGQDADSLLMASEDRLLRTLVRFAPARRAMTAAMATSLQTGAGTGSALIEWSSPDREWLFTSLIDTSSSQPTLPPELEDGGTPSQLFEYLSNRPDAPEGAFGDISIYKEIYNAAIGTLTTNSEKLSSATDAEFRSTDQDSNDVGRTQRQSDTAEHLHRGNDGEYSSLPSNTEDIEMWASSYDPSLFDDDVSMPEDEYANAEGADSEWVDADLLTSGKDHEKPHATYAKGSLDIFFTSDDEEELSSNSKGGISREVRAELTVQETLATMLRATALKRLSSVEKKLRKVTAELDLRLEKNITTSTNTTTVHETEISSMKTKDLEELCVNLLQRLSDASKAVRDLTTSAQRVGSRLLEISNSEGGSSSRMSPAKQEELVKMLDDHMANLPEDNHRPDSRGDDGNYIFGSDASDDFIDPKFGGARLPRSAVGDGEWDLDNAVNNRNNSSQENGNAMFQWSEPAADRMARLNRKQYEEDSTESDSSMMGYEDDNFPLDDFNADENDAWIPASDESPTDTGATIDNSETSTFNFGDSVYN